MVYSVFCYVPNQATLSTSVLPLPGTPADSTREVSWERIREQPGIYRWWDYVLDAELHLWRKFSSSARACLPVQISHMSVILRALSLQGLQLPGLESPAVSKHGTPLCGGRVSYFWPLPLPPRSTCSELAKLDPSSQISITGILAQLWMFLFSLSQREIQLSVSCRGRREIKLEKSSENS